VSDPRLTAIRDLIQQDPGRRGLRTDPVDNLVTACADDFEAACRSIAQMPHPSLAIVTGFYIADAEPPCCETDGPLGALFLARALEPLGIGVALFTDPACVKALDAGLTFCGMGRLAGGAPAVAIPPASHPWDDWMKVEWEDFLKCERATHLLAIERVGPSRRDGHCYSMRGRDITAFTHPAHLLFEDAARRRLATIGIGDGGNEIGMGKVAVEVLERNIPNGGRIACRVPTDYLIVAGVSNWGAYGLAAGVRLLRGAGRDADLFDPGHERELLQYMVERGPLVDGVSRRREATVDGLTWDRYAQTLRELGDILRHADTGGP
jgi:hypothetical protein